MISNLERIQKLRDEIFPDYSAAGKYWDCLTSDWRGVVLYAATLCGAQKLDARLSRCSWQELHERIDHHGMMQLRSGILKARHHFGEFGSLPERDFAPRTVKRSRHSPRPIICQEETKLSPHTAAVIDSRNQLRQHQKQGEKA
ncbi:hypothetical protein [Atlantibacter hermannii]|uniref:hypothetical protein n=1 Tax=Atlantibacter hermannii TaxID=565 RepID=UPI0030760B0E